MKRSRLFEETPGLKDVYSAGPVTERDVALSYRQRCYRRVEREPRDFPTS